jgi:hypothetical protein
MATDGNKTLKEHKRTIGSDLGDRSVCYSMLDQADEGIPESGR